MTMLAYAQMGWICDCAAYKGDECIIWPFYRLKGGYGKTTKFDGKQHLVHRLICELVKGPPPTPKHEAAHSCGNGATGCATPAHLQWKTPKENRADKRVHGTAWNVGGIKLDPKQVLEIKSIGKTLRQRDIASRFGISQANVSLILSGKAWTPEAIAARGGQIVKEFS